MDFIEEKPIYLLFFSFLRITLPITMNGFRIFVIFSNKF